MDERLRFVARILEGEPMSDVCRAFGIRLTAVPNHACVRRAGLLAIEGVEGFDGHAPNGFRIGHVAVGFEFGVHL